MLLGQIDRSSSAYYYYPDQLGSVCALTNSSGVVQNTYEYDAYGKVTAQTGTAYNPFGFTGEYTDNESGLIYLRARYYDPHTQQFLTVDPMLASTEQAYAYAAGNPVYFTDPSGNCPMCIVVVAPPLAGAAAGAAGAVGGAVVGGLASGGVIILGWLGFQSGIDAKANELLLMEPLPSPAGGNNLTNFTIGATGTLAATMATQSYAEWCETTITVAIEGKTKVSEILKGKRGTITKAPLPKGFPGWDQVGGLSWDEVVAGAKANKPGFKELKKLLGDRRFDK